MPRKKGSIQTGLENTAKALRGAGKVIKAVKKAKATKEKAKQQATSFDFGANAKTPAKKPNPYYGKPLHTRAYKITSLPVKVRKSIPALANEIDRNAKRLDATLKPGDLLAVQIRGQYRGKKFINKSAKTFTNYGELARFLRSGDSIGWRNGEQRSLIDALYLVKFNQYYEPEYKMKALASQREKAVKRREKREKEKKAVKKVRGELKQTKKALTEKQVTEMELKMKVKGLERRNKEQKKEQVRREKSLMSKIQAMAKQMQALQREMKKLQTKQKQEKKSNAKPAGKKRGTNRSSSRKR